MKIMAVINGERVCIQVVKRGETVYIRRCAYTMFEPTARQRQVRENVALTSIALYDEKEAFKEHLTREDINNAVKMAFNRWVKSRKPAPELEKLLEDEYGSQVSAVKETYKNINKN